MQNRFTIGQTVQTPFGKGLVREVRYNGRLLVDVRGRAVVVRESEVSESNAVSRRRRSNVSAERADPVQATRTSAATAVELDLHGLTIPDALARAEEALNRACLADAATVRLIHGQSGGRIRAALHRRLREISSVRGFALDPTNAGVTIVRL